MKNKVKNEDCIILTLIKTESTMRHREGISLKLQNRDRSEVVEHFGTLLKGAEDTLKHPKRGTRSQVSLYNPCDCCSMRFFAREGRMFCPHSCAFLYHREIPNH